ncbi:MAG: SGNH hydrolase-like domain-containing protein, acetyltransferase AlgX [Candidatus Electronema aureum]|uniref:SGNH hydrolase-like domain-containing protein, acetyltransferase AlgX n=1 Tax=Candidatus Electronema aureum TaxID=2005002 RepID=A0A521G0D4_9BACT|nr:MAG: SGNH hydrolase-like domain-containing protein, acetyltransferase AlgX [Candidatus Electronema aureum]
MGNRIYSAVLSTLFLLVLIVPLGLFLVSPRKEISTAEKRKLATFPKVKGNLQGMLAFPKQFDIFYQDHFGLRDSLIRASNAISLNVLHLSPSPVVIKGKEGWFFYTGESVIDDYYGQRQADAISMDEYLALFADRRDWLSRIGVRYLFIPVPNKITVYDAYLPNRIQRSRGLSFYEEFIAAANKEVTFHDTVNLYALFKRHKEERQLYFKTDTHWTNEGAMLAFNQMIAYCKQWFPEAQMRAISKDEFSIDNVPFSGDLARLMHLEKEVGETVPVVHIKQPCAGTDQPLSAQELALLPDRKAAAKAPSTNGCPQQKLTALVIHDSFGNGLRRYFNERFKRVIYSPNVPFDQLKQLISHVKPDIVFDVWVARNMQRIAPDPQLTAAVLEAQYAASDKVRLRVDNSLDINSVSLRHDLRLQPSTDGLLLQATSSDPYFVVPFTPPADGERYLVEVNVDAPQDTDFALYFTTADDQGTIRPQHRVEQNVRKGANRLLFRLPHPHVKGLIRIDPGTTTGTYLLRSLTIKAVPTTKQ